MGIPVLGLLQNMSSFVCSSCGSTTHIFGEEGARSLAEATGIQLIGKSLPNQLVNLLISRPLPNQSVNYLIGRPLPNQWNS